MSTEPTDTTPTIGTDDRSDDVPQGGFAPIVDLPEPASVATMPPPPPGVSPPWAPASSVVDADAEEDLHESAGHFPPAALADDAPMPPAPAEEREDPAPVAQVAGTPAETAVVEQDSDDGVVFFGDGPEPTPPSGWVTDDDADLILPIEPARLVSSRPAVVDEPVMAAPEAAPDAAPEWEPDPLASAAVVEPGEAVRSAADVDAVCDLVTSRLTRALGTLVGSLRDALSDDDATDMVVPRLTGPIVCLAGSEVRGVLVDDESDLFGVSLEVGEPHNVSLGIRFPVQLVRNGDGRSVVEVGGVVVTAVAGAIEVATQLHDRIDAEVATALARDVGRYFDEVDRRREDRDVTVTKLTLDSFGAIRIEVERS